MATFFSQLNNRIQNFTPSVKGRFERIFKVTVGYGESQPPEAMQPWIKKQFGSVEKVKRQEIVRIDNLITGEGILFNDLRSKRPKVKEQNLELYKLIEESRGGDFCHPKEKTPEDVFGRIEGKHCITAANVAKFDKWHGVIIFNEHHPLKFSEEKIADYLDVAQKWYKKVNSLDNAAIYPIFMWNCLWRSAASIIHGHAQILLGTTNHYIQVETLRALSEKYQKEFKSNYFEDLFLVHEKLGLAGETHGIKTISYLTPRKNKELMMLADKDSNLLAKSINEVLRMYVDKLGVKTFNLVIYFPPLRETLNAWDHFPIVVRLLDRGDLSVKTSDIGGGELYYQTVIGDSPYLVASYLNF